MIISISGTPGTGKTEVSKIIAKKTGMKLLSIRNLIKNERIPYKRDRQRKTKIIDIKDLKKAVEKNVGNKKDSIIEGHLSHLVKADIVIILRCSPEILEKRLRKKKWKKKKINENILAEVLDATTIETLEIQNKNKVFEIDTTKLNADRTAEIALRIINKKEGHKNYRTGKIDWTEKYLKRNKKITNKG
jgi:adenylate kinase